LPRLKALVFIDHDVIIRHFIKSGAFADLEKHYEVIYVFNDDPMTDKKWIFSDPFSLGLKNVVITHVPRQRMGSWYKLYAITVLNNQRGTSNYAGRKKRFAEAVGRLRVERLIFLSLPFVYPIARWWFLKKQGVFQPLVELAEKHAPDIIIQPSLLTGYYVNELLLLCKDLGIPYVLLMNSWDNPSQKAVATGHPDRLVVWGEQTRRHAIEYMRMPETDILMFGAAQFQIYRRPLTETDSELCDLFKVPQDKPIVLYAGVSKSIDETRHLRLLEEAIERHDVPECHVLYRPHPWRGGLVEGEEDFFSAGFRHVSMDPFMEPYYRRVSKSADGRFEMADYAVNARLMRVATGTISSLSTVLVETLLHGKPVISFMPRKDMENKYGRSAAISQRLAHFNDLWGRPGVFECHDDADLPEALTLLLSKSTDPDYAEAIRKAASYFVVMDGPTYSQRLVALADELTAGAA